MPDPAPNPEKPIRVEIAEQVGSTELTDEPIAYNKDTDWKAQVIDALKKSLVAARGVARGEAFAKNLKSEAVFAEMQKDEAHFSTFEARKNEIASMRVEKGILHFLDARGSAITSFMLTKSLQITVREVFMDNRARATQQAAREIKFGLPAYEKEQTPAEQAANKRTHEMLDRKVGDREATIDEAAKNPNFHAYVSPRIPVENADAFIEAWKHTDYANEIQEIFEEDPRGEAGYHVNPYKGWTPEMLREVIADRSHGDLNFKDLADKIYGDRTDAFWEELHKKGVPEALEDLVDTDDLLVAYDRVRMISRELNEDGARAEAKYSNYPSLYPHRKEVSQVAQILGDYVAYTNRMVHWVDKLRYNPGKTDTQQKAVYDAPGEIPDTLRAVFPYDEDAAKTKFESLTGKEGADHTGTAVDYRDPRATFLRAYEISNEGKDEVRARSYLNTLLRFGLTEYRLQTEEDTPLKELIEELEDIGIRTKDSGALYQLLQINDLKDLKKNGTEREEVLNRVRIGLINEGDNVERSRAVAEQDREHREIIEKKGISIVMSTQQADEVIAQLREMGPGYFTEEELENFKRTFVGGFLVVLPDYGGGFAIHLKSKSGVALDIAGAFPGWNSVGVGAALSTEFKAGDFRIAIGAGGGFSWADKKLGGGWALGGGGKIEKNFGGTKGYVEFSAGWAFGPGVPMVSLGIGIERMSTAEKYKENVNKKFLESKIGELEKTGNPYAAVKAKPNEYPAEAKILYDINNLEVGLDEASKQDLFNAAFNRYKEGLKSSAMEEASPDFFDRFVGFSAGIAMVGPIPVPYISLEFMFWHDRKIFRVASSSDKIEQVAQDRAEAALLAAVGGDATVERMELQPSGEILLDEKGHLKIVKAAGEAGMDVSKLNRFHRFEEFQKALGESADIEAKDAGNGKIELIPKGAFGNVLVYIDPKLQGSAASFEHARPPQDLSDHLYVSVGKDTPLYVKRLEISYPFEKRGGLEESVIVISDNPHVDVKVVQEESTARLEKLFGYQWKKAPINDEKVLPKQTNVLDETEYEAFRKQHATDRLTASPQTKEFEAMRRLSTRLDGALTLRGEQLDRDASIRPALDAELNALIADKKFMKTFMLEYKRLSTKGASMEFRKRHIDSDWKVNYPKLTKLITDKVQIKDAREFNFAMNKIMMASFQNIQDDKDAQASYAWYLENFHAPLMRSIFTEYYKNLPEAQRKEKVEAAVSYVISTLSTVKVKEEKPIPIPPNTRFKTNVGTNKITGERIAVNFQQTSTEFGIIGEHRLSLSASGPEGEVARFYLETLSPYTSELASEVVLDTAQTVQIYDTLDSAYVRTVVEMLNRKENEAVLLLMSPQELEGLTHIYEALDRGERFALSGAHLAAANKVLTWCDTIRAAQLSGESEVALTDNVSVAIEELYIAMGVVNKCGNPSGLYREKFRPSISQDVRQFFAGKGEATHQVSLRHGASELTARTVLAAPIRTRGGGEEDNPESDESGGGGGGGSTTLTDEEPPAAPTSPGDSASE